MRQTVTVGIVLARTDFGEADRIITFLTPDAGKLKVIARGVRKSKSKMAGGIELFSISEISSIKGRGELSTLTSTRLQQHWGNIVKELDRTQTGYDMLQSVNKVTDDMPDGDYFEILKIGLDTLNDPELKPEIVWLWFSLHLLKLTGHAINLQTDSDGQPLSEKSVYDFAISQMAFSNSPSGLFNSKHIKLMRLASSVGHPKLLQQVQDLDEIVPQLLSLVQTILKTSVRI